jgi:predicted CXXCH cytochrome family protein
MTTLRGARRSLLLATLLLFSVLPARLAAQALRPEKCADCHSTLSDSRLADPARKYPNDVHSQKGFGCLACHGGLAGHDPAAGFLSKPERRDIPKICGQCHSDGAYMRQFNPSLRTDQVSEYYTSVHGQRLVQLNDPDVAVCTDCHKAHEIRPPSDPLSSIYPSNVADTCGGCHADTTRMAKHHVPTDQLEQYRTSVHGRLMIDKGDLSAPTCNDCHGNHGAAPPGIGSIRNVCGQCHSIMADFLAQSGHIDIFQQAGLPGCETCHGNHEIQPVADSLLALRQDQVCSRCHSSADTVGHEFTEMSVLIDSLETDFGRSREDLVAAANAGMEVSQAQFELEDVNNALTKARSAIHSFHTGPVRANVDDGRKLTRAGEERAVAAMDEHSFRRQGLTMSATIILLLIAGIVLKIRQLERGMVYEEYVDHGEDAGHG